MSEVFFALLQNTYNISDRIIKTAREAYDDCAVFFSEIDDLARRNTLKVLREMQKNALSAAHLFTFSNGYGYNDAGRDITEAIYKGVFRAEAALVRPQIISGTHALNLALSGNLKHGDELICPAGAPYDTILKAIGVNGEKNALTDNGVIYKQIELLPDGGFDFDAIKNGVTQKTKMCLIQRSCGYSMRKSFLLSDIKKLIAVIKGVNAQIICLVDNCYGEFADFCEPIEAGADLCAGSLIKNPGGALAQTGGYITGRSELVANTADRLKAPGVGAMIGPNLGLVPATLQGLFSAPHTTGEALKNNVFAARLFEKLAIKVSPEFDGPHSDIVLKITFNDCKLMERFVSAIQSASCVDAFVTPEFGGTPGYDCDIIMASGGFVSGSSSELSADGPKREPYTAFLQGCQNFAHGMTAVITAAEKVFYN